MRFTFSAKKTTQAAAYLMKQAGGSMNYMKLIKLLYLADREALGSHDAPITGDDYFALKFGPVLSETLNLAKGTSQHPFWNRHIRRRSPPSYTLDLAHDPGVGELSGAEIGLLEETWQRFHRHSQFDLAELTHAQCPEWKDPGTGRNPISPDEILKTYGRTSAEIRAIGKDRAEYERISALLK